MSLVDEKAKTRKKRTVFGAIITLDDVTVNPGYNFKNWREPALKKLKQRETNMLAMKIEKMVNICNQVSFIFAVHIFVTFLFVKLSIFISIFVTDFDNFLS